MADPTLIEVADRVRATFLNGEAIEGAVLVLPASVGADWHIETDGSLDIVYFPSASCLNIRLIEKLAP